MEWSPGSDDGRPENESEVLNMEKYIMVATNEQIERSKTRGKARFYRSIIKSGGKIASRHYCGTLELVHLQQKTDCTPFRRMRAYNAH